jgi:hypothetical protein
MLFPRVVLVACFLLLSLSSVREAGAEVLSPSRLYANVYHVTAVDGNNGALPETQDGAFEAATNGIIDHGTGNGQVDGFDTWQSDNTGVATDFVGLGYDSPAIFDIVTVELGNQFVDGGDWETVPKVYVLKNPVLSAESIRPELNPGWVEVAAVPFNLPEEDEHSFDFLVTQGPGGTIHFALEGTPEERTGWGWAVGGVDGNERADGLFNFVSVTELYAEGVAAPAPPPVILPAAPQPINIVSNAYHSVNYDAEDLNDSRGEAFVSITNGVIENDGPDGFDTWHGDSDGSVTDFVGLQYNSLVEFESITIDIGHQFVDGGDWEEMPKIYILKNPVDTDQTAPEDDPANWVEVAATETGGHVFDPIVAFGQPGDTLTFSLTGPAAERTGYGWAVGGVDGNQRDDGLFNFISVTEVSAVGTVVSGNGLLGDFNHNGALDLPDIDDLTAQAAGGTHPGAYDLNSDALVNEADVNVWVTDLFSSWIGDANLDGEFNSGDLVAVLASGTYEADVDSVWSTGDFNADGRTNSSDLVAALAGGGYEQGPKAAVSAVPEPSTGLMLSIALALFGCSWRMKASG